MCYKVDVEVVIANYFADIEDTYELTLSKLKSLNNQIQEGFLEQGKYLIVEFTDESIDKVINSYPKYFSFGENKKSIMFNRACLNDFYEDVYGIFNSQVSPKIKYSFLTTLENILENESKIINVA
jgi:hypothetical protein